MKKFLIIALLFLSNLAISQKKPIINTKIISSLHYSKKELQEWENYRKIIGDNYDTGENNYSLSDKKFITEFETKYKLTNTEGYDFFDLELAPWEIEEPSCSWYCGAIYETVASSSLPQNKKNKYSIENIHDNDTRTAWVEGSKDFGIGEYVEFIFPFYAARATEGYIANGYNKDIKTWKNNSRVKTFNIYDNDSLIAILNLKDTRDLQSFTLPYPFPNRNGENTAHRDIYNEETNEILKPVRLKFVITEVYKGDKYKDTAISEFSFSGLDVHCLAKGTLIKMADKTEKKIEDILPGDLVLSYNIEKNIFEPKSISKTHFVVHTNLVKITLGRSSNITEIVTTNDHPFYTENGWMSYNPQKTKLYKRYSTTEIRKYTEGDLMKMYVENNLTSVPIQHIELINANIETYTLELDGEGAFIANGLLAGQE